MAEKKLNTRILLKTDTLENWKNSTLKIKNGEVCFATVAAEAGTGLEEPVVMMKVGTSEEKTFSELPWAFYAKSSDVLAACKSEEALTTFVNGVIANAGIASSEAMETLSGKVTAAEGEIDDLQELVGSKKVADQISEAITALDLANTYELKGEAEKVQTAINATIGTVAEGKTVVEMISEAQDAATYDDTELAGRVTTVEGKITTLVGTTEGDDAKSARTIAAEEVAKIVAGADTAYDTLKEVADWISSHKTDAAAMNSAIIALEGLVGKTAVSTQITEAINALKEGDIAAAVSRITTAEGEIDELQTEIAKKANDADLATVAKTGNVNDLIQTDGDVLIFDCGSSVV